MPILTLTPTPAQLHLVAKDMGLGSDDAWITCSWENSLWLASEYWPASVDFVGCDIIERSPSAVYPDWC